MSEEQQTATQENPADQPNSGLNLLSFMIPLVGAIIYFSNKDSYPNKAKAVGRATLWGMGTGLFLNILIMLALK